LTSSSAGHDHNHNTQLTKHLHLAIHRLTLDHMKAGPVVGLQEVAEMLGVTHQRADQLAKAYDDFPEPVAVLAVGRIWSRDAIDRWISVHTTRPTGRPRRPGRNTADTP
jgi:predicted DNA-binding transcriptional regulator AlpA